MIPVDRYDAPSLNFDADLSSNDWEFIEQMYVQLALYGMQAVVAGRYGIISDIDPALGDATALMPVVDQLDPFLYHIKSGVAITQKGQIIQVYPDVAIGIADPDARPLAAGQNFVLLARYLLQADESSMVFTHTKRWEPKYITLAPNSSLIEIMRLEDWQSASPSALYNAVPLGIVTITSTTSGTLSTSLTLSRDQYTFNRPWFSAIDIIHRGYLGSGTATTANPHALALEDLDVGPIPIFQMYRTAGAVLAKDWQYPRCPGSMQQETISAASISHNLVTLQGAPVITGALKLASTGVEVPYFYDKTRNALLLLTPVASSDTLTLEYMSATSLWPRLVGQSVRVAAAAAWEAVISEGRVVQQGRLISEQSVDLSDIGSGVQPADVYVSGLGVAYRNPQTIICEARLVADFPSGLYLVPTSTAFIRVGLPRLLINDRAALSCTVTLEGLDTLGQKQTESVVIAYTPPPLSDTNDLIPAQSMLDDLAVPAGVTLPPELARQRHLVTGTVGSFYYATKLFSSITSVRVDSLSGGSQDGTLTLQVVLDTRGACKVASLLIADHRPSLSDARSIVSTLRDSTGDDANTQAALTAAAQGLYSRLPSGTVKLTYSEDLTRPAWINISASLLDEQADDDFHYLSRAIPINFGVALVGQGYDLNKYLPSLLVGVDLGGTGYTNWHDLMPDPSQYPPGTFDWRNYLTQSPILQWAWGHLRGMGIFRRLADIIPAIGAADDGRSVGNLPTTKATALAVQCLGRTEAARIRIYSSGGTLRDTKYGNQWVNGNPISLQNTDSYLTVELRGKDVAGFVVVTARP